MNEYEIIDYIPVVGDIYRYGKLGYKIGSWLGNNSDDFNNRIILNMVDYIDKAANSNTAMEAFKNLVEASNIIDEFDFSNSKKYQLAMLYYLAARLYHVLAICQCIIYSEDLKQLKKVGKYFSEAKASCNKVWNVEKTIFTSKRELINQIRNAATEKKQEIAESKENWRKQYRRLYKKEKPVKWYLGMWIFA